LNILVSGADGFIGKYVCRILLGQQHTVYGLTRKITPEHSSSVNWIEADITEQMNDSEIKALQIDALIHLAWQELENYQSPSHVTLYPEQHYIWLCRLIDQGVKKIQVIGTCFEYGMQQGRLDESMSVDPITEYGKGKNLLRQKLTYLQAIKSFTLQWIRLFYLYGEGQRPASFVPLLMVAIQRKQPFFKMSKGDQVRDYLHVETVAKCLTGLIETEQSGIFNCCSNEPITMEHFAQHFILQSASRIKLELGFYPYSSFEPMSFWGNNKALLHALRLENLRDI
jgi:nucleoside-diphosphate-sugar epimerase